MNNKIEFAEHLTEVFEIIHKKQKWYHRIINYFDQILSAIKEFFLYVLLPAVVVYIILFILFSNL